MSIPPLVCSTPPPPDQCEDDKEPGDFDLSYNLSQEDDDDENNDYDYGNFSSYNHYHSDNKPIEINNQELTKSIETAIHGEIFMDYDHRKENKQSSNSLEECETSDINENKLKCEEDMNIEDLNLKLDEEIVTNIVENGDENEGGDQNTDSLRDLSIPCNSNNSSQGDDNAVASDYTNVINTTVPISESQVDSDDIIVERANNVNANLETNLNDVDVTCLKDDESPISIDKPLDESTLPSSNDSPEKYQQSTNQFEILSNPKLVEDDFGDFDDFQFVNTKTEINSVVDSSNPWESNDNNEMNDFGNFTANFEENKSTMQDSLQLEVVSNEIEIQGKDVDQHLSDDDEFGDFDDFKSSTTKAEASDIQEEDPCQELPVLNLQSPDSEHCITESITKVLTSVFMEEILEPDSDFEGKLESILGETWGHLMETDERQPYIINWNNSLGQKTLLKALCIDSRNILFGPKWSNHMPKYAANLSVAPLQPQKQNSPPLNVNQSEAVADKVLSKPSTWSDPFTSDGQESCNTAHESSTIAARPTDLGVFEASVSTQSEKIYSSTLSVQPIRQINLPDTHIFTPTDSEIPRSKTIHYDPGPTVLLPQSVVTDDKNPIINPPNSSNINEAKNEDEYWEFQDFKGTSNPSSLPGLVNQANIQEEKNLESTTTDDDIPKKSIAYQTQLLQPIKVEPSMPTLNWPNPGEVKTTYDDFTDFVSISTHTPPQSTEKQESIKTQLPELEGEASNVIKSNDLNSVIFKTKDSFVDVTKTASESFDDDFDTFQSALPTIESHSEAIGKTVSQLPLGRLEDFDYISPKNNNTKSESISYTTMLRSNEPSSQNSNTTELINKSLLSSSTQIQNSLLQPTPASFSTGNSQIQRTTGQILQPLSLESYSQINWPSPGIDLQDLSRFNPVETLQSLKSDLSVSGLNKVASPVHTQKISVVNQSSDDDVWGEFVSSKPKQQSSQLKKTQVFAEDDEWTDFISSPSVKPQNGLNTISLNVHTNSNIQKNVQNKLKNQNPIDIPTLNYITPKSNPQNTYSDKHFQNL